MSAKAADSFYLYLMSNAEQGNLIGNFRVSLPAPLSFDGAYEVAVTNVIFPFTFDNITDAFEDWQFYENSIFVRLNEDRATGEKQAVEVRLPTTYCSSGETLVNLINNYITRNLKSKLPGIKNVLEFNQMTRRCSANFRPLCKELWFSKKLAYILGFPQILKENSEATHPIDECSELMFIYSDIVDFQMVSNVMAPLLRVMALKGKLGETCEVPFVRPEYVSLLKNQFDSVSIQIKNDRDNVINFHNGRIALTLHFRRKRFRY